MLGEKCDWYACYFDKRDFAVALSLSSAHRSLAPSFARILSCICTLLACAACAKNIRFYLILCALLKMGEAYREGRAREWASKFGFTIAISNGVVVSFESKLKRPTDDDSSWCGACMCVTCCLSYKIATLLLLTVVAAMVCVVLAGDFLSFGRDMKYLVSSFLFLTHLTGEYSTDNPPQSNEIEIKIVFEIVGMSSFRRRRFFLPFSTYFFRSLLRAHRYPSPRAHHHQYGI